MKNRSYETTDGSIVIPLGLGVFRGMLYESEIVYEPKTETDEEGFSYRFETNAPTSYIPFAGYGLIVNAIKAGDGWLLERGTLLRRTPFETLNAILTLPFHRPPFYVEENIESISVEEVNRRLDGIGLTFEALVRSFSQELSAYHESQK